MRVSLACALDEALETVSSPYEVEAYFVWCGKFPTQVSLLSTQVHWSESLDANLKRLSVDQSDGADGAKPGTGIAAGLLTPSMLGLPIMTYISLQAILMFQLLVEANTLDAM